jgi:two-component system, LytTR family, sensor kinase
MADGLKRGSSKYWPAACLAWAVVVLLFAAQWYAYDLSRTGAEPFSYYVWWSGYLWALLTPVALWLGWRFPISGANWQRRVPLHLGASLGLTGIQLSLEACLGWLRHQHELSAAGALRHYFSQHTQISLLTYWLLVAAAVFYRTREDAREGRVRSAKLVAQLSAARLEALRQQLHPHFLFNTLQAATTLVHDDADCAEEILLRLSELLRVSLHESQEQEIRLQRELDILGHYIAIQGCRFGDRLRFDMRIDRDVLACAVPSLLLQPLVENAVRHGIGTHKENDTITIRGYRQGNKLCLAVCNLSATLEAPADQLFGRGVGLATTRERLEQLYGTEGASFHLRNLQPKGVCAEITLPYRMLPAETCSAMAEATR